MNNCIKENDNNVNDKKQVDNKGDTLETKEQNEILNENQPNQVEESNNNIDE